MTISGAIAELQNLINAGDVPVYYKGGIEKVIETILMELPTIEVSEDCISKASVISALSLYRNLIETELDPRVSAIAEIVLGTADDCIELVEKEPSVVPSRAEGEWKITNTYKDHSGRVVDRVEHTDCGYIWNREMGEPLHDYCPNCGAKMKGAEGAWLSGNAIISTTEEDKE